MQTETLIIGGGLAGLSLAANLASQNRDFLLVDARDRLGGRIMTEHCDGAGFDLGPAWFWSGQPRMIRLISGLGLPYFDQYCEGDLIYEDEHGRTQRVAGNASMQGSYRLEGGLGALIGALAYKVSKKNIHISTPITLLKKTSGGVIATTQSGQIISAHQVVLALPPRVATQIAFLPVLSLQAKLAMENIATWMAGQAKAIALYERPFWRDAGLSGEVMSRCGPMVEIHDASPEQGGPYALFGFIGLPPQTRANELALRNNLRAQLEHLFGKVAAKPKTLYVKDWAFDPYTATDLDQHPLHTHPRYGLPHILNELWGDHLLFCGTEVACQFGGFLEGALEAAENTLARLDRLKV